MKQSSIDIILYNKGDLSVYMCPAFTPEYQQLED